MSSGLKSYLSPKLGEYSLAQEGSSTTRQVEELMSDRVAPKFTL